MAESELEAAQRYEARRVDFRMTFSSPHGQRVLTYLDKICHGAQSCVSVDGRRGPVDVHRTLINEGKREVFLEIQMHLSLTAEQVFALATGYAFNQQGENTDA
jgi:hypothetical protein